MKPAIRAKTIADCAILLGIAACLAGLAFLLNPRRAEISWTAPGPGEVGLAEVYGWTSPVLWIDARDGKAYQAAHIPGALLLNEKDWDQLAPECLAAWAPGMNVVVYCDSRECDASRGVALRLERDFQLPNVFTLKGGWSEWRESHR